MYSLLYLLSLAQCYSYDIHPCSHIICCTALGQDFSRIVKNIYTEEYAMENTYGLQSLKHLLSDPLLKMVANSCSVVFRRMNIHF